MPSDVGQIKVSEEVEICAVVLRQFISLNVILTFVIFAVVALLAAVARLMLCFAVASLNVAAGLMVADQLSAIAYPLCSYCCLLLSFELLLPFCCFCIAS